MIARPAQVWEYGIVIDEYTDESGWQVGGGAVAPSAHLALAPVSDLSGASVPPPKSPDTTLLHARSTGASRQLRPGPARNAAGAARALLTLSGGGRPVLYTDVEGMPFVLPVCG